MKVSTQTSDQPKTLLKRISSTFFVLFAAGYAAVAQDLADGQAAIEEAAEGISGYFDSIQTLIFIMAGIIALLGAIRVYTKWQMGDPDVMSTAASWFGSAIFLIVAVTVIQSFFGI